VLGDSHARFIGSIFTTSLYNLVSKSVSGLKWIDYYDQKYSVCALLSLPEIQSHLSQASGVLFLVGTNSVRIMPARKIISQVQQIILSVQQNYPHLNQSKKISVSLTFPCFKTTRRFPTETSLISNINLYNEELKLLSLQMNFNILDFNITNDHLANDNMHIHASFHDDMLKSIMNHFDQLIRTIPTTTTTTTTDPILSLPSTSSSASDQEKSSKHSKRSREALDRQNKKNQEKMKIKQQQHKIMRKIHHQWTISQTKQYLDSLNIRYARIQSITNNILRILFNNQDDQDFADSHLGIDKFNENCYKEFVNNHSS
jgi:hypothetical protein